MSLLFVFAKSAVLGLAVAAPPGPVSAKTLDATLTCGRRHGLILGSSVACADALVAGAVAFGIGAILAFIESERAWISLVGGCIVGYLGLRMMQVQGSARTVHLPTSRILKLFATGFALTLSNPMTYAAFTALITALGLTPSEVSGLYALTVAGGVFLGSMLWWSILVVAAGFFRRWLDARHIAWVHRLLGCGLIVLGVLAVGTSLSGLLSG